MGSSDTTNKCFAFMQCNESCVKRIPTMPEMCRGMPEKGLLHVPPSRVCRMAAAGDGPCPPKRSPPLKCSPHVPCAMTGRIKAFSRGGRPSHAAARMRLTHAASNSREHSIVIRITSEHNAGVPLAVVSGRPGGAPFQRSKGSQGEWMGTVRRFKRSWQQCASRKVVRPASVDDRVASPCIRPMALARGLAR